MHNLSTWFPAHTTPVHVGVYEVLWLNGDVYYNYWTGKNWCWGDSTPDEAVKFKKDVYDGADIPMTWRGINKD